MAAQLEHSPVMEKLAAVNSHVNDSIISLFECPVCFEYLVPPIYQCRNSHHVCSSCKSKLNRCPSCTEAFLDSRSVFAEQIAEHLLYPCKNLEAGCIEKFSQKDISKHHAACPHRLYDCKLGKPNCVWKGRNYEIHAHMTSCHNEFAWMEEESNILYEFNIFEGIEDLQLVSACHEIFWYNFKCDAQKKKMFLAVQLIGLKELARNFTYEFSLTADGDCEKSIILKNRVNSDVEEINTIYENEACIALDFDMLKKYVRGENLSFVLRIGEVASKDDI